MQGCTQTGFHWWLSLGIFQEKGQLTDLFSPLDVTLVPPSLPSSLGLCYAEGKRGSGHCWSCGGLQRFEEGSRTKDEKELMGKGNWQTSEFGAHSSGVLYNSVSQFWLHTRNFWKKLKKQKTKKLKPGSHSQEPLCKWVGCESSPGIFNVEPRLRLRTTAAGYYVNPDTACKANIYQMNH